MGDVCTEKLVRRETTRMERRLRVGLLVLEVLLSAAMFFTLIAIPFLVVTVILKRVLCPQYDLEYEYLYINGDLDVDKIIAKKKRKHLVSFSIKNLEILAPYQSHELDAFKRDKSVEALDCTSGRNEGVYGLAMMEEGKKKLLLFEPDELMLRDIRRLAPSKVKSY